MPAKDTILNDNLQAALFHAEAGRPVFPCAPITHEPRVTGGFHAATTDMAQIKRWWRNRPDSMAGIPTGPKTGLAVLDLDMKKGKDGISALRDLGYDPDSLTNCIVETTTGGRHLFFAHPEGLGNSANKLAPGVDVRAEGGYVIAPGAVEKKGRYRLLSGDLSAPLPAWPEGLRPAPREASVATSGEREGLSLAVIREAVMALPNDGDAFASRDDWMTVGFGLHFETEGSDEGLAIFHEWSDQYKDADSAKTEALWRSANRSEGSLVTFATVRSMARRHGWHDPIMKAQWKTEMDSLFDLCWTPKELEDAEVAATMDELVGDPAAIKAKADLNAIVGPFFMDMADLLSVPAPAREWHVQDWIPAKTVHMLGGDGGTGKSLLGIQLAVATGTGAEWLGHEIGKPGVALYYGAEDDRDELHRRFEDVCRGLDVDPAEHWGRVRWRSAVAEDTVFATINRKGKVEATPVLMRMEQEIAKLKPSLVVLDTLANLHALDPNSQEHAKAFVGLLIGISQRHGCTFVLLAHPSRTGLASGDGDGFSVGWNNGVRSRSYFAADKDNPQIMVLSQKKSNYGKRGLEMKVEWHRGVFVKVNDEYADASKAKFVFLEILDRLTKQGDSFSNKPGSNYAPNRFAEEPEAEEAGINKGQFSKAMKAMLKANVLKVEDYEKPDRKKGKRLARGKFDLVQIEDVFTDDMIDDGGEQ